MKTYHLPKSIECDMNKQSPGSCLEMFKDNKAMKRHLRSVHRPSLEKLGHECTMYKCEQCDYESDRSDNVLRHFREAHLGEPRTEKKDKEDKKGKGRRK
jgi:uncharacterized C2H2 Zn-finger protein